MLGMSCALYNSCRMEQPWEWDVGKASGLGREKVVNLTAGSIYALSAMDRVADVNQTKNQDSLSAAPSAANKLCITVDRLRFRTHV